ncbi:hypothetical protein B0H11DRAFT_1907384 [Mycena galericulata]|nr:hypothetical protein B0H11DRAFT_1907384 [Mycena galericulata]
MKRLRDQYQGHRAPLPPDNRRKTQNLRRLKALQLLREELQLLHKPGSYVGEVVQIMGEGPRQGAARREIQSTPRPPHDEKVPDSTYEMVGGVNKQIKGIKEVIGPVKHPELFEALLHYAQAAQLARWVRAVEKYQGYYSYESHWYGITMRHQPASAGREDGPSGRMHGVMENTWIRQRRARGTLGAICQAVGSQRGRSEAGSDGMQ